jgi:hypothetical protein
MWAVLSFSSYTIASGPQVAVISWSASPQIDDWIKNGGGASIQGLGTVAELSVPFVLQSFADRLEAMAWGLAERYRKVLLGLLPDQHDTL